MNLLFKYKSLGINHDIDARSAEDDPRGFLITVLFDPENQDYSNEASLWAMEWNEVIVRESRR